MGANTKIEWAEATWNPLVGCTKVSPGCDHCYAETLVNRFAGKNSGFPNRFDVVTMRGEKMLTQPMRWRTPRRVFVNSLSDLFHKDVPDSFIARVLAVMALTPQHTYQLLTKRHGRMNLLLGSSRVKEGVANQIALLMKDRPGSYDLPWPLPNLWLGVSVENQQWADIRIPALLDTPAEVRFLSCEPLLGPVELEPKWLTGPDDDEHCACVDGGGCSMVDWVIVGGESGVGARPMHPDWARSLRDQCQSAATAFLFKQWGNWAPTGHLGAGVPNDAREMCVPTSLHPKRREYEHGEWLRNVGKHTAGRVLDGRTWDEYPAAPVTAAVRGGS